MTASAPPRPARAPRRTQAERTEATRAKLLDATIATLFEHGYGATTTQLVAKVAGVSRGAMQHHFPTRQDLILATADEIIRRQRQVLDEGRLAGDRPDHQLERFPDLRWQLAMQPLGIAQLEIMMGARSDPALTSGYAQFRAKLAGERQRLIEMAAERSGAAVTSEQVVVQSLITFAILGMSIFAQSSAAFDPEPYMAVLRKMRRDSLNPGRPAQN